MNTREVMGLIETILCDTHTAVLATIDKEGNPKMRWVTPGCLNERPDALYMISASNFAKIIQIQHNNLSEIMIQTKALDKVINIRGCISILKNPGLRSKVLENIGKYLSAFWKVNRPEDEMVVLEFVIDEATVYYPMKGTKIIVPFEPLEESHA
jgi:pyridoxamine 5'-phosphate oxidase